MPFHQQPSHHSPLQADLATARAAPAAQRTRSDISFAHALKLFAAFEVCVLHCIFLGPVGRCYLKKQRGACNSSSHRHRGGSRESVTGSVATGNSWRLVLPVCESHRMANWQTQRQRRQAARQRLAHTLSPTPGSILECFQVQDPHWQAVTVTVIQVPVLGPLALPYSKFTSRVSV